MKASIPLVLLLFAACTPLLAPQPSPPAEFQSRHLRQHPLAGRVWLSSEGRFITAPEALSVLKDARYVLLGEMHENRDHQALAAWVIDALARNGRVTGVSFEIFSPEDAALLSTLNSLAPAVIPEFIAGGGYQYHGAFPLPAYAEIVAAARRAQARICAADVAPGLLRRVMKAGGLAAALQSRELERLRLNVPLAAAERDDFVQRIREGHCGHAPAGMVDAMIDVQRARDALMADSLLSCGPDAGQHLLVAGAEHVRKDVAVPAVLARRGADDVVVLAMEEVAEGENDIESYNRGVGGRSKYDLIWFTPRSSVEDACERFKESLKRLKSAR